MYLFHFSSMVFLKPLKHCHDVSKQNHDVSKQNDFVMYLIRFPIRPRGNSRQDRDRRGRQSERQKRKNVDFRIKNEEIN